MEAEKIKCTVNGMLKDGKAMCGYVLVGCEFCSLKRGECSLQEGASKETAVGVLQAPNTED